MTAQTKDWDAAQKVLGFPGRMLSGSKRAQVTKEGTHLTIFNSNVFVDGVGKVWFGDIDLVFKEEDLHKLAISFGKKVYVLHEHDGRFENENRPDGEVASVAVYISDGKIGNIGKSYENYYFRNKNGKLVQKDG